MKVTGIIFDPSSFGITRKSLKVLRNALAENMKSKILVVEVPTGDITCGFFVFTNFFEDTAFAYWSGDGFRTDRGGEGGRGYASAMKMIEMFGLTHLKYYRQDILAKWDKAHSVQSDVERKDLITAIATDVLEDMYEVQQPECSFENYPNY